MPARPISPETLQLIDTVRDALAGCADVEEKTMFGCHVFMVNGKMCLGVENDELLVRLPPHTHAQVAETAGVRSLSPRGGMQGYFLVGPSAYATREAWQYWIDGALAFNPQAKATPKKKPKAAEKTAEPEAKGKKRPPAPALHSKPEPKPAAAKPKRHSVFDSDL